MTEAHGSGGTTPPGETGPLRRLLLGLVVFGILGLGAELVLLDHTETTAQWVPLAALAAGLACALAAAVRPGPRTLRPFQAVMAASVVAGLVGVYLHLGANVEWELESAPSSRGLSLYWSALQGATPALAPGALAQLGLLGLLFTYRHPALRRHLHEERP